MKASVFIATSLDGYIARNDGQLDWLDKANKTVPKGEDCGFGAFMESIDVLVMGRNTFEKVLSFGGEWGYGSTPVIVLSSRKVDIPEEFSTTVTCSSETPVELCSRLSGEGVSRIYVDGGVTIQRFLADGLIDDITITFIPVVLGSGIPLFGEMTEDISLEHISTQSYDSGFVQSKYVVTK